MSFAGSGVDFLMNIGTALRSRDAGENNIKSTIYDFTNLHNTNLNQQYQKKKKRDI